MNYNYLRYFSVLAQVEHYTLAAARLGISQPSLSSAIHNLENELGVKLFEKSGRNIKLTDQGRYFRNKVDEAMLMLSDATRTLSVSQNSAPIVLRVGYVSGALNGTVAAQIAAYIERQKRARFHLYEDSSENLMDLMRQEKLDMAIVDTTARDRSLHFRKLRQCDFYVALPLEHSLEEYEELTPGLVMEYPLIEYNYGARQGIQGYDGHSLLEDKIICQVNTVQTALELVAMGIGISIIPDECVYEREDVIYRPLKNWHQALYMCIVYDKWLEPPIWEFVEQVVDAVRNEGK